MRGRRRGGQRQRRWQEEEDPRVLGARSASSAGGAGDLGGTGAGRPLDLGESGGQDGKAPPSARASYYETSESLQSHDSVDAHADERRPLVDDPAVIAASVQRAFQRSLIVPFVRQNVVDRLDGLASLPVLLALAVFGFRRPSPLAVVDVDLQQGIVEVVNDSIFPVDMTNHSLCDEERIHQFEFPPQFILPARYTVKIFCGREAPLEHSLPSSVYHIDRASGSRGTRGGAARSPSEAGDENRDGTLESVEHHEFRLFWEHAKGDTILNPKGDAVYLWDQYDRVISALAKCDDGAYKQYMASNTERLHRAYLNLSIFLGMLRVVVLLCAGWKSLVPLLVYSGDPMGTALVQGQAHGGQFSFVAFLELWIAALCLDMLQRSAAERSGKRNQSLNHSVAVLGDRIACLCLFGTLVMLYDRPYSVVFLGLASMDFANVWFQTQHVIGDEAWNTHPKFLTMLTERMPALLPLVCTGNELLLLACMASHPAVWSSITSQSGTTPPLLWSRLLTRTLALACVLRQCITFLQLRLTMYILFWGDLLEDTDLEGTESWLPFDNANEVAQISVLAKKFSSEPGDANFTGAGSAAGGGLVGKKPNLENMRRKLRLETHRHRPGPV